MELVFTDAKKTEKQCTSLKVARKLFGGNALHLQIAFCKNKCFEAGRNY